ncbi:MAG: hypothetical protein GXP58_02185 [Deltaproteobacteria bacterium]|nr:hypothetical protein [Deltaproteobacteria bacterium]
MSGISNSLKFFPKISQKRDPVNSPEQFSPGIPGEDKPVLLGEKRFGMVYSASAFMFASFLRLKSCGIEIKRSFPILHGKDPSLLRP